MALPIGWFSTGRDEAALWLLDETLKAISKGFLPIEIAFVFCNREEGDAPQSDAFLAYVKKVGLKLIAFSSRRFLPELWKRGKSGDEEALREWRRATMKKWLPALSENSHEFPSPSSPATCSS
jgi:hypothetical protein